MWSIRPMVQQENLCWDKAVSMGHAVLLGGSSFAFQYEAFNFYFHIQWVYIQLYKKLCHTRIFCYNIMVHTHTQVLKL